MIVRRIVRKFTFNKYVFPITLLSLAFWDLKDEMLLIFDHFTISSLLYAIKEHFLATFIIISIPYIFEVFRKNSP